MFAGVEVALKAYRVARRFGPALVLAVALSSAALFFGCSSKDPSGEVMAKVNGRKISASEVDKYYANKTAGTPQQPSAEEARSVKLSILRELIDNEILMQRAEKLGLLATNEEVDNKLHEIQAPYTQEEFDKRLKERNITVDDFKRDLRRSLTIDKVINKEISSKIAISDGDITNYYNAHKAEFNLIEPQYHLAHIWVSPQPNPQVRNLKNSKAQNDAEAKRKIQEVLNRLDSGEDFGTVAMNWSEDPESAQNGGDLGYTSESSLKQTDPSTREAVIKLKPGQYSSVITIVNPQTKAVFGYRIVKLLEKAPAGQREISDPRVQQVIRSQLVTGREQLLKAAYYDVLRDEAKIDNYYAKSILTTQGGK